MIFNKQYKEFFANKIYFTVFALDTSKLLISISHFSSWSPLAGYPLADYLKKPPTITMPMVDQPNTPRPAVINLPTAFPYPHAYSQVKNYLKDMLHMQLMHCKTHPNDQTHPIFKELSAVQIIDDFHHQLEAYWCN